MCGRSRCTLSREEVLQAAGARAWLPEAGGQHYEPTYNATPGRDLPVVHRAADGSGVVVETARWGLVPSYTKAGEKPDYWRMFNARSESVQERPAFRRLMASQRCLVLLNGFYEWKKERDGKQPHYVHLSTGEPLVMAGLYDCWQGGPQGALVTFTILTSDSSPRLQWLHDRMPLVLRDRAAQETWLDTGNPASTQKLQALLGASYNGDDLAWHPVTRAMSKPDFQGPEACAPLKTPAAADFFKPKKKAAAAAAGGSAAKQQQAPLQQQAQQQQAAQVAAGEHAAGVKKEGGGSAAAATAQGMQQEGAGEQRGDVQAPVKNESLRQQAAGCGGPPTEECVAGEAAVKQEAAAAAVNADERPTACAGAAASPGHLKRKAPEADGSVGGDAGSTRDIGSSAESEKNAGATTAAQQHQLQQSPGTASEKKAKPSVLTPPGQLNITAFLSRRA